MQSWCGVQRGERIGCVGCHEMRTHAMPAGPMPAAMRRPPSRIEPIPDVPSVMDFPRDIQPILDRRCVRCHNTERYAGKLDLDGGRTEMCRVSYESIVRRGLVADGPNRPKSNYPPRQIGSSASRLLQVLLAGHHDVQFDSRELKLLRLWIETSATYPGTYAALGSGRVPVHLPGNAMHRCADCHLRESKDDAGKPVKTWNIGWGGRLCNLDRPAASLLLCAPLGREAGGLGLCGTDGWTSTADPGYRAVLAAIVAASNELQRVKRFAMPGFRPNRHYVCEMQRFGILPANLANADPVDPYTTDEAYWRSFWWQPVSSAPRTAGF